LANRSAAFIKLPPFLYLHDVRIDCIPCARRVQNTACCLILGQRLQRSFHFIQGVSSANESSTVDWEQILRRSSDLSMTKAHKTDEARYVLLSMIHANFLHLFYTSASWKHYEIHFCSGGVYLSVVGHVVDGAGSCVGDQKLLHCNGRK
jgi:hypothetical protein